VFRRDDAPRRAAQDGNDMRLLCEMQNFLFSVRARPRRLRAHWRGSVVHANIPS
jgi:hypothetical protein